MGFFLISDAASLQINSQPCMHARGLVTNKSLDFFTAAVARFRMSKGSGRRALKETLKTEKPAPTP